MTQELQKRQMMENLVIPENTENVMWQEYQQWLAEGNTPEAAD